MPKPRDIQLSFVHPHFPESKPASTREMNLVFGDIQNDLKAITYEFNNVILPLLKTLPYSPVDPNVDAFDSATGALDGKHIYVDEHVTSGAYYNAKDNVPKTIYEVFAEFKTRLDDLDAKYNGNLKNADKVDGFDASMSPGSGTIPVTDQNGDLNLPSGSVNCNGYLAIADGMSEPATAVGKAIIYVDQTSGDLMVKFSDGTIKTIVVDT